MKQLSVLRKVVVSRGQRDFVNLPTYKRGSNTLWVFVNGKKEFCGEKYDYVELSNNSVKFNKDIPSGAVVEFLILGLPE